MVTNKSAALHRAADARHAAVRERRRASSAATPRRTPSRIPSRCSRRRGGWASTPARCIYVGDDERDIVAGRAAGMRTVAATYGYLGEQADVDALEADAAIASPLELLQLLEQA